MVEKILEESEGVQTVCREYKLFIIIFFFLFPTFTINKLCFAKCVEGEKEEQKFVNPRRKDWWQGLEREREKRSFWWKLRVDKITGRSRIFIFVPRKLIFLFIYSRDDQSLDYGFAFLSPFSFFSMPGRGRVVFVLITLIVELIVKISEEFLRNNFGQILNVDPNKRNKNKNKKIRQWNR